MLPSSTSTKTFTPSHTRITFHDPYRAQDRFGLLPEALFQSRQRNVSAGIPKEHRWKLVKSYLPDWFITVAFFVAFYFVDSISGFQREFDLNDTSIQHTHAQTERVPILFLALYAIAIPAFAVLLCSQALLRSFWDTHSGLLGLFLSLALNLAITGSVKNAVGRPRPDFIDRCRPLAGSLNSPVGLSNISICTSDHESRLLVDGFRSFPSGHSSTAWCGLGYLSLYFAGKVHLFDERGHTLKAWLALSPLLGAALIAISRTMDYRHHVSPSSQSYTPYLSLLTSGTGSERHLSFEKWHDVTAGSLLGIATAYFGYRLYYPSLSSPQSHKPYSPRIQRQQSHGRNISASAFPLVRDTDLHQIRISQESEDIMLRAATQVPDQARQHDHQKIEAPSNISP